MQNGNQFKLGLFGMNCSGSVGTTAPERWNAEWPETREAALLADAAGLEFLLPIARWLGYGGATDRHGTSFETLSWASALLAATKDIVTFATVHVPLVNPIFAAKVLRHGGPCRSRTLRSQRRVRLEHRGVRHVRRPASRT